MNRKYYGRSEEMLNLRSRNRKYRGRSKLGCGRSRENWLWLRPKWPRLRPQRKSFCLGCGRGGHDSARSHVRFGVLALAAAEVKLVAPAAKAVFSVFVLHRRNESGCARSQGGKNNCLSYFKGPDCIVFGFKQ